MNESNTAFAPRLAARGQCESFQFGGESFEILLDGKDTGGLSILEVFVDPDFGPPLHVHTHEDEFFIIHEGEFEFIIGDAKVYAGPGDTLFAPRGIAHRFRNSGSQTGRFHLIVNGDNFLPFIRKWATAFPEGSAMMRALEEHDIALA